ncbi:MAG: hypothetical protein ABIQ95_04915 [Bdellovibrionia bacterium]
MRITDTYSKLQSSLSLKHAHPVFQGWGYSEAEITKWFKEYTTPKMRETARLYLKEVTGVVTLVEQVFGTTLSGELVLIPSMGEVDGFARFDRGHHTVMLGIDFPDASLDYLKALTAHELSHVYRDHSPEVWGFLGKPLNELSRKEYLEAMTGREHLVSEGLATLTSQLIFPEVLAHDHHYYEADEMKWCLDNDEKINISLMKCLNSSEPDPWKFYGSGVVAKGSPSRTHYYWAARKIEAWIKSTPGMSLVKAHSLHADQIRAF